jgi:cysteinyl-tRNA synthetase
MYVCGPTVYNLAHIGNARPVVVFDTLFRLLQTEYDEVVYARNITDIDDKIIAAAKERGEGIDAVATEFAKKYREDVAAAQRAAADPGAARHGQHRRHAGAHGGADRARPCLCPRDTCCST